MDHEVVLDGFLGDQGQAEVGVVREAAAAHVDVLLQVLAFVDGKELRDQVQLVAVGHAAFFEAADEAQHAHRCAGVAGLAVGLA